MTPKEKILIVRAAMEACMRNFIEKKLLELGLFDNHEEQHALIENRYRIQYKKCEFISKSFDNLQTLKKMPSFSRQHSF